MGPHHIKGDLLWFMFVTFVVTVPPWRMIKLVNVEILLAGVQQSKVLSFK